MRVKKRLSIFLVFVIMASMLLGCGSVKNEENSSSKPENQTITDHAGRTVEGKGNYKKIVSAYYISTSMLIALGLENNIVGIEAKADKRPIYKLAAPELLNLPNVGTAKDFNLEGCMALEPDLVILPKKLSDQGQTLADMGITVVVINPENQELLKESLDMIAKITGTTERANKLTTYYSDKFKELEKITANSKEKPKVYMAGVSDILTVASKDMYQNSIIEKAGGVNVASDVKGANFANISYEQLINYNPDIMVIVPESKIKKEDVMKDSQLANINAVKNNKVYEMPSSFEAWDSPVPSGILGTMWLASIINEKEYSFDEFKKDVAEFYKEFYGIDIDKGLISK